MTFLIPIFLLLPLVHCHVSLTFPEARYPPFDFLDTSRTMGPCGVPKPKMAHYTNLVVGNTYNFTWRMQYPHQGGYRLLLLDIDGKEVEKIVPVNGIEFTGTDDTLAQSERVRFSRPCESCTVALERQASEWGKSYRFKSCADVNIVENQDESSVCNGRGTMDSGKCSCEEGYTGDICQYFAHCERDSDCLNGGKCHSEPESLEQKTCYCSYGFFGNKCQHNFKQENDQCFAYSVRDEEKFDKHGMFNSSCFNEEKLNDNDVVYYRKVKNDVEIILDFASSSWVSIGWRPEQLDPSCRLFPDLEGVRSKRDITSANQTTSFEDPLPPSSEIRRDQPPLRVAQEGPRPSMPRNNGLASSALEAPLHAMDCVDMIVASVKDGRSKVTDRYSRDRSTPLDDSWFDGEMSLVAAVAIEKDGRTVVMFRRMIQEIEPSDHPLGPGRQFVIWAKGQTQGSYHHSTVSGVDKSQSKEAAMFYADDVLKYHGSKNRGVASIDFCASIKLPKPSDAAFGVNIAQGNDVLAVKPPSKGMEKIQKKEERKEAEKEHYSESSSMFIPMILSFAIILFTSFI